MSVEAILSAIENSGDVALAQLDWETETRIQQIQVEVEQRAAIRRESARQAVISLVAGESARRLHQARLEALRIVAAARDQLVASTLDQVRQCLMDLRHERAYARVLRRLIEEAVWALGDEELNSAAAAANAQVWLEIDARDDTLARAILLDLALDLAIQPSLHCWGGVSVRSGDGRIIVTNTLESRLERVTPYLRQELAAFFEALSGSAAGEADNT